MDIPLDLSPPRTAPTELAPGIVLGGGVMQHPALYPLIRARFLERLAGYLDVPEIVDRVDDYLVPAGLGQDAGLLGAVVLGQRGLGCHG